MPYIRTMKDWSKKTYYTSSEMDKMLEKAILKHADDLVREIREEKDRKGIFENVISNEIQYV